ncbi:MAG: hypothetical protein LBR16_05950 [Treponema sp.]|jgi:hypothetical protein|nr:hypothetical protein [Treponema sp.]
MNTIPSTISETLPPYTAIGGGRREGAGLSLVILNRANPASRFAFFQELEKEGFDRIVSIEAGGQRYDIEELAARFPQVRFIILQDEISPGAQVNLGAAEVESPFFLVIWNDCRITRGGDAGHILERVLLGAAPSGGAQDDARAPRLCTVPIVQTAQAETLATLCAPAIKRFVISTAPFVPDREGAPTLFPYEGMGIYDRERFFRIGGYDAGMRNFHWQLLDFGFRCWLWGEELAATRSVKLSCSGQIPVHDCSLDDSYRRFYLKNLAPVFRADHANIPIRAFPGYAFRSRIGLFASWMEFSAARRWAAQNRYRFRLGIPRLNSLWREIPDLGSGEGGE